MSFLHAKFVFYIDRRNRLHLPRRRPYFRPQVVTSVPLAMSTPNPVPNSEERLELASVLNSGILAKSPRQARLLQHVCDEYFAGRADQIKEYRLATEVLGRAPDFDQDRDAIVRVEFHRLRHKLKQYYESEGAGHTLRIVIDPGHYVPRFVPQEHHHVFPSLLQRGIRNGANNSVPPPEPESNFEPSAQTAAAASPEPRRTLALPILLVISAGLALLVLVTAAVTLGWWRRLGGRVQHTPTAGGNASVAPAVATGSTNHVRILCGYPKDLHIDRDGNAWTGDRYYTGGEALSQPQQFIARTAEMTLFESLRIGAFSYNIPLKPGNYELHLYFVESHYGPGTLSGGGETSRLFNVMMNGKPLLKIFDIIKDAGGNNVADVRVFKDVQPDADGYLHLKFEPLTDVPTLSALEIEPAPPGKINPVRIVAGDHSYTDHAGNLWRSDHYYNGGQLALHITRIPVGRTDDPDLYSSERFGHFSYAIPVAPGKYRATLRFAETYWAVPNRYPSLPDQNGSLNGGAESRVFDVYCNGVALLRNFDIFKEAGGTLKALDKTFHNLEPNAEGKLLFTFVPVRDYACINALEVENEP